MTTYGEIEAPRWNLLEMLRAELAWYPGRPALVGRIVLACTTVMVLAEVFRIPGGALGASFPLLISRESPAASRKTAFQIALSCSIATLWVILGGVLTAGSPFLHLMWVIVSLLGAFYVISALNYINPALTASVTIAVAIHLWGLPISAETRVEHTLYTLLGILMACVITSILETMFAKKDPPDAVLVGINRRLALVEALLVGTDEADFPAPALRIQLNRAAARGVDDLSALLENSTYDPGYRVLLATMIPLTRQVVELGANLGESAPVLTASDRERCKAIARNLASVRYCLTCPEIPDWVDLPLATYATNPILGEIERTVDLIAESHTERLPVRQPSPAKPVSTSIRDFVSASFAEPEHLKFAVRGALSAMVCYLFYMSLGWTGLNASLITCTLTARRFTGASRYRQSLRVIGFILGAGVVGLGAEAFILPHLNTLPEYALLFAAVVALGSWIATSGPRIAYAGFQLLLAYSLVNLDIFTINTTLVPSRDAILGILLGVVAMWLVFDHLWAETSSAPVRNLLLATLRRLADFSAGAVEGTPEANQQLIAASTKTSKDFDTLRDLADMYAFESFPKQPNESLVNRSIRTLLPELRAFQFLKTGLLQHRYLATDAGRDALVEEVEVHASGALQGLANAIEREAPEELSSHRKEIEELRGKVFLEEERSRAGNDRQRYIEMRLCASLLGIVSHLQWRSRLNFKIQAFEEGVTGGDAGAGILASEAAGFRGN